MSNIDERNKPKLKLLILEDTEDELILLLRHLKKSKYLIEYTHVSTLEGFLENLLSQEFDAIISDHQLGSFSGLDALAAMKTQGIDLPFIMVSGVYGEETAIGAMGFGAHDYIVKDNLFRLIPAIEREIKNATLRKREKSSENNEYSSASEGDDSKAYSKDDNAKIFKKGDADKKFSDDDKSKDFMGKVSLFPPNSDISGENFQRYGIFVINEQPIISQGLALAFNQTQHLWICGSSKDPVDALAQIRKTQPHLIILDFELSGIGPLDYISRLHSLYKDAKILVLSDKDETLYGPRAISAGAGGFITKDRPMEDIIKAINAVIKGHLFISTQLQNHLLKKVLYEKNMAQKDDDSSKIHALTNRELEIFRLIGQGQSLGEIGKCLGISPKTVDAHRENIKDKLGLASSSELLKMAISWFSNK